MPCCHRVVFGCPRFALVPRRTARGPPASRPAVGHPGLWPCRTPISPAPHLPQGGDRHRRQQCPRILARRCDGSIADAAERKKPKKGGGRELATRERSEDVRRLPTAPAQIRALLPRPVPPRTSTPRSPCTPGRRPSSLPPHPLAGPPHQCARGPPPPPVNAARGGLWDWTGGHPNSRLSIPSRFPDSPVESASPLSIRRFPLSLH